MANVRELKYDLEEFKRLLGLTTREKVRDILAMEVRKLQTSILTLEEKEAPVSEPSANSPSKTEGSQVRVPKTYTVNVENYAWDQSDKFMKIYVTADGVGKLPQENVTCEFTQSSFHLLIRELNGKNYRLGVSHLMYPIIPETSKFKVKADSVLVMLKKSEVKTWAYMTKREADAKESKDKMPKYDESQDPQESLMNMMKKMYEDGDDEMKRTIAKAWTESREKSMSDLPGM